MARRSTLLVAREVTEQWLEEYNAIRPYESLGGMTPTNIICYRSRAGVCPLLSGPKNGPLLSSYLAGQVSSRQPSSVYKEITMSAWRSSVVRYQLLLFVALTYPLSWWAVPFAQGALIPHGPALAAIVVVGLTEGRPACHSGGAALAQAGGISSVPPSSPPICWPPTSSASYWVCRSPRPFNCLRRLFC